MRMTQSRQIGRRAAAGIAALAAAIITGGAGTVASAAPTSSTGPKPAFYLEVSRGSGLVRSTATGTVTSKVKCPERDATLQNGVAAANNETFFIDCQQFVRRGHGLVIQTNLHRLELTRNGHVRVLSLVHDGSLTRFDGDSVAASPDGTELAVEGTNDAFAAGPPEIYVFNTAKRTRALWTEGNWRPTTVFIDSVSFTGDGRELTFLAHHFCPEGSSCKNYSDVRSLNPQARGGQLSNSKVLLSLAAIAPAPKDTVADSVISPDGSALTLVIDKRRKPTSLSGLISVIKVSVTSGRQLAVLYRPHPVDLDATPQFFSADPSVSQLLIGYESQRPISGWLTGGKVIPLPHEANFIAYLAW